MALSFAPRDTQATWYPTWIFEAPALPHVYAGRDLSLPSVSLMGSPFITGESAAGGDDLVGGGGAGADALHAWGRITDVSTVTRTITDPFWPIVEVQSGSVTVADQLTGDYAGESCTLIRYDGVSGLQLSEFVGIITQTRVDHAGTTIEWSSVDRAVLEEPVPIGVIDTATFPQAAADALGVNAPWVFGNVTALPVPCVRDDQINSIFDYALCRGSAAALTRLRRVLPGGTASFVTLGEGPDYTNGYIELEPYPGMDGVLVNPSFEDWDAAAPAPPDGWTLAGTGATVTKTVIPANVSEGSASAALFRLTTDCHLQQDLVDSGAIPMPLAWWQGRLMDLEADVLTTSVNSGRIEIRDGLSVTTSAFHSGGGTFERLQVTHVINPAGSLARLRLTVTGSANTTVYFDNVRIFLRAISWAEVLRPELYEGSTALRFYLRQEESTSGALYPIVADVNGLQPERNPVRAIRTLLSDPTHGAGLTVDAPSFNAGEVAASLTFEDAILLDAPVLFLPFRDVVPNAAAASVVVRDRSGYENHGLAFNGGGGIPIALGGPASGEVTPFFSHASNWDDAALALPAAGSVGTYVQVPSHPAYSGQAITVECWVQIYSGNLPDAGIYPLVEKLVGTASLSGYGLYRHGPLLIFFVRGVDAVFSSVSSPLVDGADEGRWMHVVGRAVSGTLLLFRDGVQAASGTYSSAIAEGEGEVLVGRFGGGVGNPGRDWMDNVILYAASVAAARIAAHTAAPALDLTLPTVTYPMAMASLAPSPEVFYQLGEPPGSTVMIDASGNAHNGVYVGAPVLGEPGPLAATRGYVNSPSAVRFANNVAQYGVETGLTLAGTAGTLAVFYAPAAKNVKAGLCEKTIGGVRDTQWGLCQRADPGWGSIRFTLVTSGGTFTVDAPLVAADRNRFVYLVATWGSGSIEVYKDGILAASGPYTGTPASGVGDFYVGVQGTVGGVRTRPGQGALALLTYHTWKWDAATVAAALTWATWYNGGSRVDLAMTEPRPLQDWLGQIGQLLGIRIGFNATGAVTVSVDAEAPTTIQYAARDGVGDGDRNLVEIRDRQRPLLEDRTRTVVVRYRRDLLTGEYSAHGAADGERGAGQEAHLHV